jgi:hypothetical protein
LTIPYCQSPCTLQALRSGADDVIPENWEEECGIYQIGLTHYYICKSSNRLNLLGRLDVALIITAFLLLAIAAFVRIYRVRVTCSNESINKAYRLLEEENGDPEL